MSAQPAAKAGLVTADELMELPDDGQRYELVEGRLRAMSPAGFDHGGVAVRIGGRLDEFVRGRRLGRVVGAETGFRLSRDPDTVRAPDAAFVAADRLPPRDEQHRFLELAPDLAVEVVSPTDRAGEVTEKAFAWLAAGVSLVWVVYPAQRLVAVYSPDGSVTHRRVGEEVDGGAVLPGFRLPVDEIFD